MNIGEFRAFLEGMAIEKAPTPEQWARIKKKVESLQAVAAPAPLPSDYPTPSPLIPRGIEITDPPPGTYPIVTS